MPLTQEEFEVLLNAPKRIVGDIAWAEDEDHSPAVGFRASVESDLGYPLFLCGSFNREAQTLSYTLVHPGSGRIYALDMGKDHRNPDGVLVGETHKHRWRDPVRDKEAYVPEDINAHVLDPVAVWGQFCHEGNIEHLGRFGEPPPIQGALFP